ncbi:MAG: hypothetical protein WC975_16115 [Phycisphaerae bacterium]
MSKKVTSTVVLVPQNGKGYGNPMTKDQADKFVGECLGSEGGGLGTFRSTTTKSGEKAIELMRFSEEFTHEILKALNTQKQKG